MKVEGGREAETAAEGDAPPLAAAAALDCAMDIVDCRERSSVRSCRVVQEIAGNVALTSEMVLSSVNGVRTKPTAVRAVLPTSRSPAGVSLTLSVAAVADEDFARKREERPTRDRRRESERK